MAGGRGDVQGTASGVRPLMTRALTRESGRARRLLAAGEWRPSDADAEAAARLLARLTAPLPARATVAGAPAWAEYRDRRLQRIWRTAVHHLDAGAVSPPAAALLAAVARAFLPWYATPNPPGAAAAPHYPVSQGLADDSLPVPPTEAGEALLPGLAALFAELATPRPSGTPALTPSPMPWQVRHAGRFRHYSRPAPGVWTADTFHCPGCTRADGPWTITCDWHRITLTCPCGRPTDDHGLTFSEIHLVLPDL